MLDGVNDSVVQARALLARVAGVPSKVNLIPFNPFPGSAFGTSPRSRVLAFQKVLQDGGLVTTIRKTRGDDIDAACGQLAGRVDDRSKRRLVRLQWSPALPAVGARRVPGDPLIPAATPCAHAGRQRCSPCCSPAARRSNPPRTCRRRRAPVKQQEVRAGPVAAACSWARLLRARTDGRRARG
jgi:hypothetical protein